MRPGDGQDAARADGRRPRRGSRTSSFFAFTATPKARTLELFGSARHGGRRYAPFHLYSMRQAIEEGFILDVLANYTTYDDLLAGRARRSSDDPEVRRGARRGARSRGSSSLHPHNLAQKAEIVVEHFRAHTAQQDRRQGEGDGRHQLAAPRRPLQAGDRHVHRRAAATPTCRTLVAFSGHGRSTTGDEFTEPSMNDFPESGRRREQLRRRRLPAC
ncbi:MAG: hypothetical protein WKF78_13835 [Candidatus Limnocylindrales bacterium]